MLEKEIKRAAGFLEQTVVYDEGFHVKKKVLENQFVASRDVTKVEKEERNLFFLVL